MSEDEREKLRERQFPKQCRILIFYFYVKKSQTSSPITSAAKLYIEKWHFNTGAYDQLMTKTLIRVLVLIIFILRLKVKKIQTVSRVDKTM